MRYRPGAARGVALQGFGAELALKSDEYTTVDDRKAVAGAEEEGAEAEAEEEGEAGEQPTLLLRRRAEEPLGPEALLLSEDPTALSDALADVVEDAWDRGFIKQDSMESDPVTFAGFGDPLLRLPALEAAAAAIKHRRHGAQLRVMTNGMVAASEALDVVQRLKGCGVKMLTVPLNAATPPSYAKMMSPPDGVGFQDVVNFVGVAAENGLSVECTAVSGVPKQPKSTPKKVEKVAMGCGATAFRLREWVPAAAE